MRTFFAAFFLILILTAGALADTVVFNSFGPGQSINSGYETVNSVLPFTVGMRFTSTSSVRLTEIAAPWAVMNGADLSSNTLLTVDLFNDVGGQPGSVLESWTVLVTPPFNCPGSPLTNDSPLHCMESTYTLDSLLSPNLFANQAYWLFVQGQPRYAIYWGRYLNTGTDGYWAGGNLLGQGPYREVFVNSPALQVTGADVPEPGSLALLATGLIAAFAWRPKLQMK